MAFAIREIENQPQPLSEGSPPPDPSRKVNLTLLPQSRINRRTALRRIVVGTTALIATGVLAPTLLETPRRPAIAKPAGRLIYPG